MKLKIAMWVAVAIVACNLSVAAKTGKTTSGESLPRVFSLNARAVSALRARIATGQFTDPALIRLREQADKLLEMAPVSVMEKDAVPPSGSKHDYMSLATYFWPDPAKPDGLPYIRRDGEVNPDNSKIPDHRMCGEMVSATQTLSLAYYLFRDERYGDKAAVLLRTWFLDPATRMNPNMNYAQAIRGVNEGRGIGLIDTRGFSRVVDSVGLLATSKSWTAADQKGMQAWFGAYLKWLQESKNGKDESRTKNNHVTYYDTQLASIALFTGNKPLATRVLKNETNRIAEQVTSTGEQPLELVRTRALSYSTGNLAGLFQLAALAEKVNVDLWNFQTSDGRSIRKALDYLAPFVTGEKPWPHQQITEYSGSQISTLFVIASVKYHNPQYEQMSRKMDPAVCSRIETLLAKFEQNK